jgi:VanZ family protein
LKGVINMSMTAKRVIRFCLLIAWLGLTIFLSEQTGAESARLSHKLSEWIIRVFNLHIDISRVETFLRELAHFGIHFVLAILAYRAFLTITREKPSMLICLILCAAIAIFDELTQRSIPGRAREVNDLLLNLFGVSLGANLGYLISKPLIKSLW